MHPLHYVYRALGAIIIYAICTKASNIFNLSFYYSLGAMLLVFGLLRELIFNIIDFVIGAVAYIIPIYPFVNALKLRFLPEAAQMKPSGRYYWNSQQPAYFGELDYLKKEFLRLADQKASLVSMAVSETMVPHEKA